MKKIVKMGRPKLPDGQVRGVYPLRLSGAERALFERAAKAEKEKLPEWMRKTLTSAAKSIL
jgi:uncharacterized protein (DUF1778 family)